MNVMTDCLPRQQTKTWSIVYTTSMQEVRVVSFSLHIEKSDGVGCTCDGV